MGELIPLSKNDLDDFYERACSHYVELLDGQVKPPKLQEVYASLSAEHPDLYPPDAQPQFLVKLRTKEFNDLLAERRRSHIIETLAPRLLAAQMGSRIGARAMERLLEKLDDKESEIDDKVLIDLAKLGFSLAEKVDKDLSVAADERPVVRDAFQTIIMGLPEDKAQAMALDLIRRARQRAVGDGS